MDQYDCLIPAAGRSERMGRWKALLPYGGSTIIEQVVHTALKNCSRVFVVTGYRGRELETLFRGMDGVETVHNKNWERGKFSSIQTGIRLITSAKFFITLGDLPYVTDAVYRKLIDHPPAEVLFPALGGVRGHPVLFDGRVIPKVLEADASTGEMRRICKLFDTRILPWPDDSILRDIDTPADYARTRAGE